MFTTKISKTDKRICLGICAGQFVLGAISVVAGVITLAKLAKG